MAKKIDLNLLLADLSIMQKVGDIKLERKINTYIITKGENVFTFLCGAVHENMAFDFQKNGKKIYIGDIQEFTDLIDKTSGKKLIEEKPNWGKIEYDELADVPNEKIEELKKLLMAEKQAEQDLFNGKNYEKKERKTMQEKKPVQKSFDLNGAAANFAQAILAQQADSDSLNEKLSAMQAQIDSFQMPRPLEIKINEMPEIKLEQNSCSILEDLLRAAYTRQNAYIFGPAGCGKTTAAKQVAQAMGLNFGYICLTAGASETWLFGRNTPNGFIEGEFSKIYKNGGVFLADEMDAADSNLLIALNTAIDSNQLLNPMSGEVITRHKDFVFIGAGNTNGLGATGNYNGRSRLDASTLSRFVFFEMNYDEKLEAVLCLDKNIYQALIKTREYLQGRKSENFITTRDFIKLSKMFTAGSSYDFCLKSLTCNFSEVEKEEVKKFWQFKQPKKKVMTQDEIPF